MDDERVDPVALRVAARSERKSLGRLSSLIRASLALVWSSGRGLFIALLALQLVAAVALAGQVLAVQSVLDAVLVAAASEPPISSIINPVLVLAGLTAVSMIAAGAQGQVQ